MSNKIQIQIQKLAWSRCAHRHFMDDVEMPFYVYQYHEISHCTALSIQMLEADCLSAMLFGHRHRRRHLSVSKQRRMFGQLIAIAYLEMKAGCMAKLVVLLVTGQLRQAAILQILFIVLRLDADTRTEKMTNIKNDKLVHSLSGVR